MNEENINSENETDRPLTRRERRKLAKEEKKLKKETSAVPSNLSKYAIWILVSGIVFWGLWSLFKDSTKPLPGEEIAELGREHVTDIAGVEYSSDPPTSGAHFAVWAKPGVYDRFISDGYLIHSLEHGYIVISYDCSKPLTAYRLVPEAFAHDEPAEESTDSGELLKHLEYAPASGTSWFTPENPPEEELALPEEFKSDSCKDLASEISKYADEAQRVVIVPRLNADTPIALTAWRKIMKLDGIDDDKIKDFISSYHNKGPEKTLE